MASLAFWLDSLRLLTVKRAALTAHIIRKKIVAKTSAANNEYAVVALGHLSALKDSLKKPDCDHHGNTQADRPR